MLTLWVVLDDDAELQDRDSLARILRVLALRPDVACLALNCQGSWRGGPPLEQMALLPGRWAQSAPEAVGGERAWPVAEFIGAGCAFDMDAFRAAGGFPPGYGYGYEEPHLAYRLLDAGRSILYVQSIQVRHHHSTTWRVPNAERMSSLVSNKCAMAAELFPVPSIPPAVALFAGRVIYEGLRSRVRGVHPRIVERNVKILLRTRNAQG